MEGLVHCVPQKIPVMEQTEVWIVRSEYQPENYKVVHYSVFASEDEAIDWSETLEGDGEKTEVIKSMLTAQTGYRYPNRPEYGDAAGETFKDFTLRIR